MIRALFLPFIFILAASTLLAAGPKRGKNESDVQARRVELETLKAPALRMEQAAKSSERMEMALALGDRAKIAALDGSLAIAAFRHGPTRIGNFTEVSKDSDLFFQHNEMFNRLWDSQVVGNLYQSKDNGLVAIIQNRNPRVDPNYYLVIRSKLMPNENSGKLLVYKIDSIDSKQIILTKISGESGDRAILVRGLGSIIPN